MCLAFKEWMRHATHIWLRLSTPKWGMTRIYIDKLCQTCEWFILHMQNKAYHQRTHTHTRTTHTTHTYTHPNSVPSNWICLSLTPEMLVESSLSIKCCDMCDVTHSYFQRNSFMCATWLIHMCDVTSYVTPDSFICATWLIHMCDATHSYVHHNLLICASWLLHMCNVTRHESFICVTCLIHMCDMTHSYVWHDSFICATWLIHICDMTPS